MTPKSLNARELLRDYCGARDCEFDVICRQFLNPDSPIYVVVMNKDFFYVKMSCSKLILMSFLSQEGVFVPPIFSLPRKLNRPLS